MVEHGAPERLMWGDSEVWVSTKQNPLGLYKDIIGIMEKNMETVKL